MSTYRGGEWYQKFVGLGNFWSDLGVSDAFVTGLEFSFLSVSSRLGVSVLQFYMTQGLEVSNLFSLQKARRTCDHSVFSLARSCTLDFDCKRFVLQRRYCETSDEPACKMLALLKITARERLFRQFPSLRHVTLLQWFMQMVHGFYRFAKQIKENIAWPCNITFMSFTISGIRISRFQQSF